MRSRIWPPAFVLLFAVSSGCLPERREPLGAKPAVLLEPMGELGSERVVRFYVTAPTPLEPEDAWLFVGELSEYHLGRVARRELPETLLTRRVAVNAWSDAVQHQTVVVPAHPLQPGEHYSLAAPGWGELLRFDVAGESPYPLMKRLWPPVDVAGNSSAVLCGSSAEGLEGELVLAPSGSPATIARGLGRLASREACVRLELRGDSLSGSWQVLPALASGALWDPSPLEFTTIREAEAPSCARDELALPTACVLVQDDRVLLRNAAEPALYALDREGETLLTVLAAGQETELRDFAPDSDQLLEGRTTDVFGVERAFAVPFHTLPPRPHVILNEVLANALGAEPASEWIEILNDSSSAVQLAGFRLSDSAGEISLPAFELEPLEYALLVREDFVENGSDVPVAPGTRLLRVAALGKNGLSNSGEPLSLLNAAGQVVSRFPARASAHAGVSLARRSAGAGESDPQAFGEHAPPGASPGAANTLKDLK
ncbi:MAG: lamin tail domain-containing protein [Myxococcota bacterium]